MAIGRYPVSVAAQCCHDTVLVAGSTVSPNGSCANLSRRPKIGGLLVA